MLELGDMIAVVVERGAQSRAGGPPSVHFMVPLSGRHHKE
jgi:hypothetical protein